MPLPSAEKEVSLCLLSHAQPLFGLIASGSFFIYHHHVLIVFTTTCANYLTKDFETLVGDCGWSLLFSSHHSSKKCSDNSLK